MPVSQHVGASGPRNTSRPWIRRSLSVTLVVTALWTPASRVTADSDGQATPLLWTIAGEPPSYLFGTIHIADPRVLDLPATVTKAFEASDDVRTEIPLDPQAMMAVAQGLMLPDGKTLNDVLPADVVQRLETYLEARGMSLAPFQGMKPWVVASMLSILDARELMLAEPLDQVLYNRARDAGKHVGGLETAQEQLDILDSLDDEAEASLVAETLDMLEEDADYLETLILTYLSGDADELLRMVSEFGADADPMVKEYGRRLVEDRNHIMATRIDGLLGEHVGRSFFFAVGAGHMAGPEGIVTLLRQRGFEVERVAP